jgi:allantoin racemase
MKPVVVINPNSNAAVTAGLDAALAGFRLKGGPAIECLTLAEGPFGVESQLHVEQVTLPLARLVESRPDAGAFVIACYSDPGLELCRTVTPAPVFGIMASGVMTAMARADRFGVIALSETSIRRHLRSLRAMGVGDRLVGERAADLSVAASGGDAAFDALLAAGRALVADGAQAVVLGCAGMARQRPGLEAALGVPVIDPTQAAVAMALGAVLA